MHTKLGAYETQTIGEIWGSSDNGCHRYDVEEAHENIVERLVERQLDDETAVHSLRVAGKYRVHGILRENVFHILWIDHEHKMWPVEKQHT